MQITTTVTLESGDSFAYTADAAAAQVLAALGGNPTNDLSSVNIQTNQWGQAGTPPPPLMPPTE
jgi:hypothetical protein